MRTRLSVTSNSIRRLLTGCSDSSGQSIIEFAVILPLLLVLVLGVVEVGYALFDQQVVTKLTREGSNLTSRDVSFQDTVTALTTMSTRPVDFNDGSSRLILSVLYKGATVGSNNYNQVILRQRYEYGSYPGSSKLTIAGSGSFNGLPDYEAVNPDSNTGLQVTNVPSNIVVAPGGLVYVTEIYTRHVLITPFDRFGVSVPQTLYSIAYF
jgi:hypothetical protein